MDPHFRLIGEASDGLEAVTKARELLPDLILMDNGLPTLSGFEAARRIRFLVPATRIMFVAQETDIDIMQEAFRLGACDFIAKHRAGSELNIAAGIHLQKPAHCEQPTGDESRIQCLI